MVTFHGTSSRMARRRPAFAFPTTSVAALGSSKRPAVPRRSPGTPTAAAWPPCAACSCSRFSRRARERGRRRRRRARRDARARTEPRRRERAARLRGGGSTAETRRPGASSTGCRTDNKQRYVLAIEGTKSDETRQRRIARSVEARCETGGCERIKRRRLRVGSRARAATSRRAGPARPNARP